MIELGMFRKFCDMLRASLSADDKQIAVNITYKHGGTHVETVAWDVTGTLGTVSTIQSQGWDYTKNSGAWQDLWAGTMYDQAQLDQARIILGNVSVPTTDELIAQDKDDDSSYVVPTKLIASLGPVVPSTLDEIPSENGCYGLIKVSIGGMGYFSWQPLPKYWETFAKVQLYRS